MNKAFTSTQLVYSWYKTIKVPTAQWFSARAKNRGSTSGFHLLLPLAKGLENAVRVASTLQACRIKGYVTLFYCPLWQTETKAPAKLSEWSFYHEMQGSAPLPYLKTESYTQCEKSRI